MTLQYKEESLKTQQKQGIIKKPLTNNNIYISSPLKLMTKIQAGFLTYGSSYFPTFPLLQWLYRISSPITVNKGCSGF